MNGSVLADGNKDQIRQLRAQAAARGITLAIVADFIHVTGYLWDAAWCIFPEASPDAGPRVRHRAAEVPDGRAAQVAAALRKTAARTARHLETKGPLAGLPQGPRGRVAHLRRRHRRRLPPPGKDRMAITGARRGVQTAGAILKLRALGANGDFDEYWAYHLPREHHRNHPYHYDLAA